MSVSLQISNSATPHLKNIVDFKLEDYFTEKNIVDLLIKYRIKAASQRHKHHLMRNISSHELAKSRLENIPPDIQEIIASLPPRRQWRRPDQKNRKIINNSQSISILSIKRCIYYTKYNVRNNREVMPNWLIKLNKIVEEVKERTTQIDYIIKEPVIKPVKKEDHKSCRACRPLSVYSLVDRIIISLTARYFIDLCDPYFLNNSYAFRSTRLKGEVEVANHHLVIRDVNKYRKGFDLESLWVAECDIRKFFDCVNHDVAKSTLDKFLNENNLNIDVNAKRIFYKYLDSYSFNYNVLPLNDSGFFKDKNLGDCFFEWHEEELLDKFYRSQPVHASDKKQTSIVDRVGIPQGGALSCFISNLILHSADLAIQKLELNNNLFYARYCDDMIIIHPDKDVCARALNEYKNCVLENKLLIHEPEEASIYSRNFWKTKSKKPYKWAKYKFSLDSVPWLSFVGYQLNYDGQIRIRKKSLDKEIHKHKKEFKEVLRALGQFSGSEMNINDVSRKTLRQHIHALESRYVSMSVGRVKLHRPNQVHGLCWTNGFKSLSDNPILRSQLKKLDKSRGRHVYLLKKKLAQLTIASTNREFRKNIKFYGAPFSYYGFLIRKGSVID
ncbi:reverse transcriptase domain-containing protein [Tellurirhabdus rosea]|uniref:reverse transcriptase domain-containing protein n=1 Tax=Tellurirhabdus rosea TaxID=2674997 RepID=UPI0022552705|nr:reverse transcriptase domain-containing protein [Tellurirhabdus rosea]